MEPGTRLGHFEILDRLGAGGMGEVYLAQDTRLGRKVAIKVLPAEFASDPERLARFEQEARAAAALNHPHIAVVHDIGTEGDTHFMVQEYLEGDTLREPLGKGALPLKKALGLATEIAEALAAAHAAGIVHRDLKPENIFVTKEGHAKVLDFGLAKLTEVAVTASPGGATQSPTMMGTVAGQVMGTAGYMAPEQVEGSEEIDHRADLFAFGCVLYEMVSGRKSFPGRSVVETLQRLVHEEPEPLGEGDAGLPSELQRIVRKCLAKEPGRRYQGADDLAVDLLALIADVEAGRATGDSVAAPVGRLRTSPATIAVALIAGSLLGVTLYAMLFTAGSGAVGDARPIYLPLGGVSGLDVDSGSAQMALSPDSRWLAYQGADNRLYRVPVEGGRPQPCTERLGSVAGTATWTESGEILLGGNFFIPLRRIPSGSGDDEPLFERDREAGEIAHGTASYLPDGDRILYSYWDNRWRVGVHSLSTGERTPLTEGYGARYVPTGHLVWILAEQMMAATFDLVTLELGDPIQLLSNLGADPGWGRPAYDFSLDGTLAYLEGAREKSSAIVRIDEDGTRTVVRAGDRELRRIALSPTEDRLALDALTVDGDIQIWSV